MRGGKLEGNHQACYNLLALEWPPFLTIDMEGEEVVGINGIMTEILDILVDRIGFCYDIFRPKPSSWGMLLANSTFTGMLDSFNKQEPDMSIVPIAMSHDRAQAIDFGEFFFIDAGRLQYLRPQPLPDLAGFVNVFPSWLWALLLATTILSVVLTFFVHYGQTVLLESSQNNAQHENVAQARISIGSSFYRSILWNCSLLLNQSVPWDPRGISTRVITGIWLLMTFILGTLYRSNLKAMLILPRLKVPFDTLQEFLETDVPLFLLNGSLIDNYVMNSPDNSTVGRLKAKAVRHSDVMRAIAEIHEGKYAALASFLSTKYSLDLFFSKAGYCANYVASETLMEANAIGLGFSRDTDIKPKVDEIIRRLRDAGIMEKLYSDSVRNASECLKPINADQGNELRSLEIRDFLGVFALYFGGMFTALIAFGVEKLTQKLENKREETSTVLPLSSAVLLKLQLG